MKLTESEKKVRKIAKSSLGLSIVATIISFVGSILMFLDYRSEYTYRYGFYGYDYYHTNNPCPETGIMPFFAFFFILLATIFIGVAIRKSRGLAIASFVLTLTAQPLLFASVAKWQGDAVLPFIGYCICIVAGIFTHFACVLDIVYAPIALKQSKVKKLAEKPDSPEQSIDLQPQEQPKPVKTVPAKNQEIEVPNVATCVAKPTEQPPTPLAQAKAETPAEVVAPVAQAKAETKVSNGDVCQKLTTLKELFDLGILSEKEYSAEKKKLIDSI